MSQNKLFRGVKTFITRPTPHTIEGFYRETMVACLTTHPGGMRVVHLNNGGWMTATTKLRMNQFSNEFCNSAFKVYQEKREWYVKRGEEVHRFTGQTITFTI